MNDCPLCREPGGLLLWQSGAIRVVLVEDPHYPGFCRVIWHDHVREMTDLPAVQQQALMGVVFAVERVVRDLCQPDKINLASFGNMVPHLHWHIIPRWRDDRHFPEPVWGSVQRDGAARPPAPEPARWRLALATALGPPDAGGDSPGSGLN